MNQIEQLAEILFNAAKQKDFIIISIDSLSSFSLLDFKNKYPERVIEMGISEFSSVGVAYGISLTNRKVFIVGFSSFIVLRGLEAIRSYLSYQNANVTILGGMSGLSHAEDGYMHQSYDDIGILSSLTNLKIYTPSDYNSLKSIINHVLTQEEPSFIRLYRVQIDLEKWRIEDEWEPLKIRKFNDECVVTIFSYGHILRECLIASEKLQEDGIKTNVIEILQVSPLPEEKILNLIENSEYVVSVEDHILKTGLAKEIIECCYKKGIDYKKIISIGAENEYVGQSGNVNQLIENIGANSEKIYDLVSTIVK